MAIPNHPLADLFPMIGEDDFATLVDSIRENGLRERIVVHEGQILDGRNRYRALLAAGVLTYDDDPYLLDKAGRPRMLRPQFRKFLSDRDGDPLRYVVDHNLHRRHLDESQRAMVAARLADMSVGGNGSNQHKSTKTEEKQNNGNRTNRSDCTTNAEAGKILKVSPMSVKRAKRVLKAGTPELAAAVEARKIAVTLAAELTALPVKEQKEIIELADRKALRAAARTVREADQRLKRERRAEREGRLAGRQAALPEKKYGVIYADPEWRFDPYSRETGMDRAADNHYPTSDLATLQRRDVGAIAADDCVLFMWATVPMLAEAFCCLDSWGFAWFDRRDGHLTPDKRKCRYVSQFAWDKAASGNGYWTRNRHELLLIATRGKPVAPALGEQLDSMIRSRKSGHSAKPEKVLDWIDKTWPNTARIELNRRGPARPGWDAWGNEAEAAEV